MNWVEYGVQETDLQALKEHNHPITVNGAHLMPNAGVEIRTATGQKYDAIYDAELKAIRRLNRTNPQFNDLKNRDLALYNDHLLNENINTIIVDGFFGTGKTSTVCAHLVEGLVKDLQHKEGGIPVAYISKPHVTLGSGYGFLPGDLHNKMAEEFKSYTQYFDRFYNPGFANYLMLRDMDEFKHFDDEQEDGLAASRLELLPFEYLRGRDIPEGWVILDEAQNTNVKEMSTFLARPCDPAKLILLGDTNKTQIDRGGNTPTNNGLAFAKETFQGKSYCGCVTMQSSGHILRGVRVRDLFKKLKADSLL